MAKVAKYLSYKNCSFLIYFNDKQQEDEQFLVLLKNPLSKSGLVQIEYTSLSKAALRFIKKEIELSRKPLAPL